MWADTTLDFNPITARLDLVLDNTALGNATGLTVAFTDYDCTTFSNGGALTTDANGNFVCSADDSSAGGGNSFETIAVPAGASVVADSSTDTLTLTETSFLTLTGTAATDTIDITQVTTDLGTDGLIAADAVALGTDTTNAYVTDLTAGTYIDVSGGGLETATVTVTVDPTEILDVTFAAGANASQAWTWNHSGTDPVLTASSNTITVTGDIAASGIAGPDITLTPTSGDSAGMHAELNGASDTEFYLKNDTRFILDEWPGGLVLGGNSAASSVVYVQLRATTSGDAGVRLPDDSINPDELKTTDAPTDEECATFEATGNTLEWQTCGAGGGDSITVNASAATDPDFLDGDVDWTLTGGNSITATVACSGCIDATDAGTDSVSADELNATGVEAELEVALDIGGEVTSTGMASTVIADTITVTGWVLGTSSATTFTAGTVNIDLLDAVGAVDMDYGSVDVTDHTFITDGTTDADFVVPLTSIGAAEIVTDALTTTQMAATLTFADADLLDFGTNISAVNEGILIPAHATTCVSATSEGQLCWEEDADNLWIGDGAAAKQMNGGGADTNADKEFVWPMSALLPLEAADSIPPIAKDAGTNLDLLPVDFDASTDECRTFSVLAPPDITAGGTVTFSVTWYSAAATTGSVVLDVRHNSGVAEGVDPDAALTTEASAADAVAGTAGQITVTTWTETQTNLAWAASDLVVGVVCRDANHLSDDLVGDMRALTFGIRIPRS